MPLADSFDTPGWFTRDYKTYERVAMAVLGEDAAELPTQPRLLKAVDVFGLAEDGPGRALDAIVQRIDRMLSPVTDVTAAAPDFDALYWAFRYLQGAEAWASHGAFIEEMRPALGPGIAERFWAARDVTKAQVKESMGVRKAFRAHFASLLGTDGVLVLPTMPGPAPLLASTDEELETNRAQSLRMLCLSGHSGFPQITIPWRARTARRSACR